MRNRSETIYATNEEEYIEVFIFQLQRMNLNESITRKRIKKSKLSMQVEKIEKENDYLSSNKAFHIEQKPLTLIEREIQEQELLESKLKNIGISLKKKDKHAFLRNIIDLSKESLQSESFGFKLKTQKRTSSSRNLDSLGFDESKNNFSKVYETCSTNEDSFSNLIFQNIDVTEDKFKIMVIGEKYVGKSLLISRLTNSDVYHEGYYPTQR
jgi:hypothetical protein